MTYDTVVVGAGLAGLTSAVRLAELGQRVAVVAKGVGATHLAPASIDVLGYAGGKRIEQPVAALADLPPDHPYSRVGPQLVAESVEWLKGLFGYVGSLDENLLLPTAVGVPKPTAVVPESFVAGDLRGGGRFVFVGFRGLKDFYPAYLAANVTRAGCEARALEVVRPPGPGADLNALWLAREFDRPAFRAWVVRELRGKLEPDERVGFPAVLGLAPNAWRELRDALERPVFEVPTLPPSVSGLRLFEQLTSRLRAAGGRLVLGDRVGRGETTGRRLESVLGEGAARPLRLRASSFVLATGGFEAGGLELDSYGHVRETALDLPVAGVAASSEPRFLPGYFDDHPLQRAGLAVDERLRPVDASGQPFADNLHAAGAILGGAVPWREQSGNGIALATGYAAAAAIASEAPVLQAVS
jgi:glycerol-3-phosphate dehydrogenase subunit B